MNTYVVSVWHYFSGYKDFYIEANNRLDAIEKVKADLLRLGGGNYNLKNMKVNKKAKKGGRDK